MRSPGRSLSIIAGAVLIAVIAAAIALWIRHARSREAALPPDWTAITSVLAGDGRHGTRDGPAPRARFSDPFGVAVAPDGAVYVADAG